jgi:hypothetical protein
MCVARHTHIMVEGMVRDDLSWCTCLLCALQPEQIRQCLVDYASINVWQLDGTDSEAPSIVLARA